jgi:hypothetical protein
MATPFDISQVLNLLVQLLPFVIVLAILPMVIRLVTSFLKE